MGQYCAAIVHFNDNGQKVSPAAIVRLNDIGHTVEDSQSTALTLLFSVSVAIPVAQELALFAHEHSYTICKDRCYPLTA